ncbi:MAG TPA: glycosyltransferase family 4 protein [Vicinamibacteria bacterium]|nr:glycosyltransferase family 4 protein [Vicinamibacteria bacterium]
MKLGCVIHRYGADVTGGSEAHCRGIAERLAERHDVTVLTSCARDYLTWRNAYPPGETSEGRVRVRRFPVARPRDLRRFRAISLVVFGGRASAADQRRWFEENGPLVPDLVRHLSDHGREFDRILFFSYRYYTSFFGLPTVADRAILVPTAEEDPLIRAPILAPFFSLPRGYLFNTVEEAELIADRMSGRRPPALIVGVGVDPPGQAPDTSPLAEAGVRRPYVLYLGRIEPNKGCDTLLRYFPRHPQPSDRPVTLVMAGPATMPIPAHARIQPLGVVSSKLREALLAHAVALVVPSPYESLSMVLLEAWNHGVPALVNGRCRVLKGQVLRGDGGLYYADRREFSAALGLLMDEPEVARRLGAQGRAYVDREYRWPVVMEKVEAMLCQ